MKKESKIINQTIEHLSVQIYNAYGSSSGYLFGLNPDLRPTVNAIIKVIVKSTQISKALLFIEHLEQHKEVINAPINTGIPMCKICNKTIDEIFRESKGIK